jgi:hypothetical protein
MSMNHAAEPCTGHKASPLQIGGSGTRTGWRQFISIHGILSFHRHGFSGVWGRRLWMRSAMVQTLAQLLITAFVPLVLLQCSIGSTNACTRCGNYSTAVHPTTSGLARRINVA